MEVNMIKTFYTHVWKEIQSRYITGMHDNAMTQGWRESMRT